VRRMLEICDLRLTSESAVLRIFHKLLLIQWQEKHSKSAQVVDLQGKRSEVREAGSKPDGSLRCVVVSDLHGWGPELKLPTGDVLFLCGNMLLSGAALSTTRAAPSDLKAALMAFHGPEYNKFRWIFLVGGSHDRPLHELWAEEPDSLYELLPPNVVLLQAPAKLEPPLPGTCAACEPGVRACADSGAVKLLPDLMLCPPGDSRTGWVIAGSGVSLAGGALTTDRAFQLLGDDADTRKQAAEALLLHSPCIVLTHGPPKGHCDRGGGDAELAEAIDRCKSVQVHLFGHVPEAYGAEFGNDRAYVNAAITTPLYVPTREPMLFDLPALPSKEPGPPPEPKPVSPTPVLPPNPTPAPQPGPTPAPPPVPEPTPADKKIIRVRRLPADTTPWDVCVILKGFWVATMTEPFLRAGSMEVTVNFIIHDSAKVLPDLQSRRTDLEFCASSLQDLLQVKEETGGKLVCLYDIINVKRDEKLTPDELSRAIEAGIISKDPLFRN